MPALRAVHPAAERNVVRSAARLRDEAEVLDDAVDAVLRGRRQVAGAELAALPPALARLVLRHLAEDAAGRAAPDAAERFDELVALTAASGSAALSLHGGLRAVSEYGVLRFAAGEPPPQRADAPVDLGVPGEAHFGAWSVRARPGPLTPRDGVLDAGALHGGLVVRAWRQGDRMAPLGLGGTRTLGDLFTDRKVPRERRRSLPVVECGGEIAWVPGVATSERFRIGPATLEAVHLSAHRQG